MVASELSEEKRKQYLHIVNVVLTDSIGVMIKTVNSTVMSITKEIV